MNRQRLAWIALLACSAALAFRFLSRGPSAEKIHISYTQAAGYGIGQLLARDFPAGGKVVYLVPGASDEVIASQFKPHAEGMKLGHGGKSLDVVMEIGEGEGAPRRSALEMVGIPIRPLAAAAAVLQRHPDAVAMVAGVTPSDLPPLAARQGLPPLYVLDATADPRWPELLRRGEVKGVVTRNPEGDLLPMPKGLQSPEEVFSLRFKIVSP